MAQEGYIDCSGCGRMFSTTRPFEITLYNAHDCMKHTREHAIATIEVTADYYHSMIDSDSTYWQVAHETALDLLERIQGLEEGSLLVEHNQTCSCVE